LDFGDYQDDYFSFMTDEGEAISQLIGGYIDILLKKRKVRKNLFLRRLLNQVMIFVPTSKRAHAKRVALGCGARARGRHGDACDDRRSRRRSWRTHQGNADRSLCFSSKSTINNNQQPSTTLRAW
jgi:hypothetical protein